MSETNERSYPLVATVDGVEITIRLMGDEDRSEVVEFARRLPTHDLLFLRRDITDPDAVHRWIAEIEAGDVSTLLAIAEEGVVGYATVDRSRLPWSSHVAELRVLVGESMRGRGLGRHLTQEAFALALSSGIDKMVARMTLDQKGAIAVFEGLGFRPEALLKDHVKDRDGNKHDLIVMAHDVEGFGRTLDSYGVTEALDG